MRCKDCRAVALGLLIPMLAATTGGAQTVVPGAGVVSDSEVSGFVAADRNRDGVLSFSEFKVFVGHMAAAGQSTAKTIRGFGAYGIAFRRVDANGDGVATPGELRRADNSFRAGG